MMKRINLTFLTIFLLFISTVNLSGFSLEEVLEEALKKNPEIVAAEEHWKAAEAHVTAIRSWPDPQVGISYERIPDESLSPSDAQMRMYSITQKIPFPGKITMKSRIAKKDASIAREHLEEKRIEIMTKVKSVYYTLFLIHKSIEIHKENKELIQNFTKIAESKYSLGKATQHDVLKAQVELSLIIDDLLTLEHEDLPSAEATLNVLLNRKPDSTLGIPEEIDISTVNKSLEQLKELALENNPKLKSMSFSVEKSGDKLTLAKMEYLPDFTVRLMHQEMEMATGIEATRGIMFSMNIPLWFWKQGSSVKEKNAHKNAIHSHYDEMKNSILVNVQNSLSDVDVSERRLNLFKTSILPQAEQTLKAATIAYQTGKIDFLALMNSERMYRDARLKYYRVLTKHGKNHALLEKAIGATLDD